MLTDVLKKRLKAGEVLYGTFIDSCNEDMVEISAIAGFDYALIDAEHSPCDPIIAQRLVRAADARNLPTLIRVSNSLPSTILKMMDIGASGIMAPLVHDAEMAKGVVESVRYYPAGRRGTALMRASNYNTLPIGDYFAKTNSDAFVMVQAESVQAVENLEKVLAVKDLDAIFLGPYDLSQSMGIPGQVESKQILEIAERIAKLARAAGKFAGTIAGSYEKSQRLVDMGYQLITYSTDLDLYCAYARETVANLKKIRRK